MKGPDEEIAGNILNRIAAKVVPIMKKHGMDVMNLEEFEPNREFLGRFSFYCTSLTRRNWNAGENVELVLKTLNGSWLPFTMVQLDIPALTLDPKVTLSGFLKLKLVLCFMNYLIFAP